MERWIEPFMLAVMPLVPLASRVRRGKHSYTKYRLKVKLYKVENLTEEVVWIDLDRIDTIPISSLTKKALKNFL